MVINTRVFKNKKRGTGVRFVTIPINEARNISESELQTALGMNLGENCDGVIYSSETAGIDANRDRWAHMPFFTAGDKAPHKEYNDTNINKIINKLIEDKDSHAQAVVVFGDTPRRGWDDEGYKLSGILRVKKYKDKILVIPHPVVHDIYDYGGRHREEGALISPDKAFNDLTGILRNGFNGFKSGHYSIKDNAHIQHPKRNIGIHKTTYWGHDARIKDSGKVIEGDYYSLEMIPRKGRAANEGSTGFTKCGVDEAKPEDIVAVNVIMSPGTPQEEKQKKIDFYTKELTEKYHVPLRFYEQGATVPPLYFNRVMPDEVRKYLEKKKTLEHKVTSIVAIGSLAISALFLSSNITGNAIASLNQTSSNWIGVLFFIIGLIGAFLYFRNK